MSNYSEPFEKQSESSSCSTDEVTALRQELDLIREDGFRWLLETGIRRPKPFVFEYPATPDLVSVIIPAYNTAHFLERCIRSVWNQQLNGRELEILLCEDGSTDETYEKALALQSISPLPMRILTHPQRVNKGVSATRNMGMRHARGAYLALLDVDDVWLPQRLAVQLDYFDRHPEAQCVCSFGFNRDLEGNLTEGWNGSTVAGAWHHNQPPYNYQAPYTFDQLLIGDPIVNSTLLIRREAIASVGGYPEVAAHQIEDWLLVTKLSLQAPIALIEQELVDYTVHPASYTSQYFEQGLAYGAKLEFLYYLVHWMLQHPTHHDQGVQIFRHYYPQLLAANPQACQRVERFYQEQQQDFTEIRANFEAQLAALQAEVEELRRYRAFMEGRLNMLRRIPGLRWSYRLLRKVKAYLKSL